MNKKKSLVSYRWGAARPPSSIVRVSLDTRKILDTIPDKFRRSFIDTAVRVGVRSRWFSSIMKGVGK